MHSPPVSPRAVLNARASIEVRYQCRPPRRPHGMLPAENVYQPAYTYKKNTRKACTYISQHIRSVSLRALNARATIEVRYQCRAPRRPHGMLPALRTYMSQHIHKRVRISANIYVHVYVYQPAYTCMYVRRASCREACTYIRQRRTTTLQKCAAVPRRARIQGS